MNTNERRFSIALCALALAAAALVWFVVQSPKTVPPHEPNDLAQAEETADSADIVEPARPRVDARPEVADSAAEPEDEAFVLFVRSSSDGSPVAGVSVQIGDDVARDTDVQGAIEFDAVPEAGAEVTLTGAMLWEESIVVPVADANPIDGGADRELFVSLASRIDVQVFGDTSLVEPSEIEYQLATLPDVPERVKLGEAYRFALVAFRQWNPRMYRRMFESQVEPEEGSGSIEYPSRVEPVSASFDEASKRATIWVRFEGEVALITLAPGIVPETHRIAVAPDVPIEIDFEPRRRPVVEGVVVGADGNPVAASVRVVAKSRFRIDETVPFDRTNSPGIHIDGGPRTGLESAVASSSVEVIAGDDGRFEVELPFNGSGEVTASYEGMTAAVTFEASSRYASVSDLRVVLQPRVVRMRLLDPDGRPLADLPVWVLEADPDPLAVARELDGKTDAEGYLDVSTLEIGAEHFFLPKGHKFPAVGAALEPEGTVRFVRR